MDVSRRGMWVLGGAVAVALGLLIGFVVATRGARPVAAAPARVAPTEPGIEIEAPVEATFAVVPAASDAARGTDEVEVCGGGWVKLDENDQPVDAEGFGKGFERPIARDRILARMRASPDEFVRMAAVLAAPGERADRIQAVAQLAANSHDARVYAAAFKLCGIALPDEAPGACQMLRADRWAQLDPGNAAPWSFLLAAAKERGDAAAVDEALFQLASAKRSHTGYAEAAGAVVAAAPDDDDSTLAASSMAFDLIGMDAATLMPPLQPLLKACRGDALRDANRAQNCASVAETMTERSDTMVERFIGVGIGAGLGWPAERVDRLRGEQAAFYEGASFDTLGADQSFSCARIRTELRRIGDMGRLGEPGLLREWVAHSGKSPEDFIAIQRAAAERRARAASAAASAASASSR